MSEVELRGCAACCVVLLGVSLGGEGRGMRGEKGWGGEAGWMVWLCLWLHLWLWAMGYGLWVRQRCSRAWLFRW